MADSSRDRPLVSCIMPTRDRRRFVARAIDHFLAQDYPNRELVILDDGDDRVEDLIPAFAPEGASIRYHAMDGRMTVGRKRNVANELSAGEIVIHWDDDDWMHGSRIARQVEALLASGAGVTGAARVLFYEMRRGELWLYTYPAGARAWLYGATLCYHRPLWERTPFEDVRVGEDTRFIWAQPSGVIHEMEDIRLYVAMIHPGNTSPKGLGGRRWSRWHEESFASIAGEGASFYESLHGTPMMVR